ncbi:MAG: TRAP transporter substrate-binding protein, partial [Staphylococcus equorum]|nr:TRAP transporter substrate-binding protein [Staphylococcus equorum]
MKKILALFVSAFFITGMLALSLPHTYVNAEEKTKEIMLAHNQPTSHPVHKSLEIFKERLEETSHGQLKVNIYPNGQLGSEREAIEMTQ